MELLIDATRSYPVDRVTRSVSKGKKALRELPVDTLYLNHYLGEKETGSDVLEWANGNRLLPREVVRVTANPIGRTDMARFLSNAGYRSSDGIRFSRRF